MVEARWCALCKGPLPTVKKVMLPHDFFQNFLALARLFWSDFRTLSLYSLMLLSIFVLGRKLDAEHGHKGEYMRMALNRNTAAKEATKCSAIAERKGD